MLNKSLLIYLLKVYPINPHIIFPGRCGSLVILKEKVQVENVVS